MSIDSRHARVAVTATALALAATGVLAPPAATAADHRTAGHRLEAALRPSGDPDGSGEAHFTLNSARRRVCARVTWEHIGAPNAAHIHRASDGAVVVDLTGSVTGGARCATGVSPRTITRLLRHPGRYYFNVHNATYPAGAIQGRLRR